MQIAEQTELAAMNGVSGNEQARTAHLAVAQVYWSKRTQKQPRRGPTGLSPRSQGGFGTAKRAYSGLTSEKPNNDSALPVE